MSYAAVKAKAADLFSEASFISHINDDSDYEKALELMDELIDDYETYRPLIEVLSVAIKNWEDKAKQFADFNARIDSLDSGVAVLRTLMDQYQLKAEDLKDEIGSKSLVSMILNGSRNLTLQHVQALSNRFNLAPSVFF